MDGDIPICNISNTNTSKIILEIHIYQNCVAIDSITNTANSFDI